MTLVLGKSALSIPSTRRRVFHSTSTRVIVHHPNYDAANAIDEQRSEFQGLLLKESAAAGILPSQAQEGAQAVRGQEGCLGQEADAIFAGQDEDQEGCRGLG